MRLIIISIVPRNSFYRDKNIELNPKWVFSGGLKLAGNEYSYVSIEADHSRQGSFKETVFGAMYGYKDWRLPG